MLISIVEEVHLEPVSTIFGQAVKGQINVEQTLEQKMKREKRIYVNGAQLCWFWLNTVFCDVVVENIEVIEN